MGRDAEVGKDPEQRNSKTVIKSEVQRLEEASASFADEAHEQTINDSSKQQSKSKNVPGHVELISEESHRDRSAATYQYDYERTLKTQGVGMYQVGQELGNGTKVTSIQIREGFNLANVGDKSILVNWKADGQADWKTEMRSDGKYTEVHLDNGAALIFENNHLFSVIYKSGTCASFLRDRNNEVDRVELPLKNKGGERFQKIGPNEWSHWAIVDKAGEAGYDTLPFGKWHGSFKVSPTGEVEKIGANGQVLVIYSIDGDIMTPDQKKLKQK